MYGHIFLDSRDFDVDIFEGVIILNTTGSFLCINMEISQIHIQPMFLIGKAIGRKIRIFP